MAIRHTDVLVVGGELAGAVAAATVARAGKRVVVLEEGEGDDSEVAGNVIVPPVDDLWPALDGLARAMNPLEALGQKQDLRRTIPFSTRALQILHPEHRLDLFTDPALRAADLRREAGEPGAINARNLDDADDVAKAAFTVVESLDPFVPEGFFADRRTRARYRETLPTTRDVPALSGPPELRWLTDTLKGALPFVSNSVDTPPWAVQRLLKALMGGVHVSPLGVRNALRAQLLELARQRGAEIIREERVAAFVVEGGRISEVRLAQRSDAISPKAVIDATWARDVRDRVSPEKHARKLDAMFVNTPIKRVRVGIAWAVKKEGVPPGLGERALVAATGTGPGDDVALLSCTRQPLNVDSRKPVPNLAVLSLCTHVDQGQADNGIARLTERLKQLFPFTERHLVEARSDGKSKFRIAHGAIYGTPEDPSLLGGRGIDGGLKGLFRAGRDVAPVLGAEGEIWAGHAAAVLAERLVSKKPLFGGQAAEPAP